MIDVKIKSTLCDDDIHEGCGNEVTITDDGVGRVVRCFCKCHGRPDIDD